MKNTSDRRKHLPTEFSTEEEASEFWDTHSLADYEEDLESVDLEGKIERRHFEIEVDERSFFALRSTARREQKPLKQLVGEILKRELA